jgi:primary-amine oxidase
VVRSWFEGQGLNFRVITLKEPRKDELVTYLEAEHRGDCTLPRIGRCARVEVLLKNKKGANELFELIVAIDSNDVIKQKHLEGKHSYIDSAYMKEVEEACLADPRVQAEIKTLELPEGAIVIVEPWAYATDGSSDMSRRISMVLSRSIRLQKEPMLIFSAVLVLPSTSSSSRCELLCLPT